VNRAARRALERAAQSVIPAFEQAGPFPGQEVTPPLLVDALRQCLEICQQADTAEAALPVEELNELGTQALECLSDLGFWAFQLQLDEARACIEDLALDMAHWIIMRGGRIAVVEPLVNALARQANASREPAVLSKLAERALAVIGNAAPVLADDPAQREPWRTLHVNCAIVATRAGDPERMAAALDLLEEHLPADCEAFYREGLRETARDGYSDAVRELMRSRFAKWTDRR
jgi:hypothetical protein